MEPGTFMCTIAAREAGTQGVWHFQLYGGLCLTRCVCGGRGSISSVEGSEITRKASSGKTSCPQT